MGLGSLDHRDHQYVVNVIYVISVSPCLNSYLTFDTLQGRMGPRGLKGVPGVNGAPVRNILINILVFYKMHLDRVKGKRLDLKTAVNIMMSLIL